MYVPPEVLRWIFVQIIGTQNALKTSGLVSERRIVRCVEEAEKDYDRMLAEKRNQATWFEVDRGAFTLTVKGAPPREELNEPEIREQLVVEYYSR